MAISPAFAQGPGELDALAAKYEAELSALEQAKSQFDPDVAAVAGEYAQVLLAKDTPFPQWHAHPSLYWLLVHAIAPVEVGQTLRDADWLEASAQVAQAMEANEAAEDRRRRALALRRQLLPAGDAGIAAAQARLAGTLADLGRVDEAESLANDALAAPSSAAAESATATLALAKVRALRGQPAEAEALFKRAVQGRGQAFGDSHPLTLDARFDYARFLRAQGRAAEAEAIVGPMLAQLTAARSGGPRTLRVLLEAADQLRDPAQCAQASATIASVRDSSLGQLHTTAKQAMRLWESSGRLQSCAGNYAQAAADFERAASAFLSAEDFRDSAEFGLANARFALALAGHAEVADAAGRYARQAVGIAGSRRRQGFANSDAPSFGNAVDRAVHRLGGGNPLSLAYEADLAVDWPAHQQGQTWAIAQAFKSAQELSWSGAATAMAQTRARTAAGGGALAQVVARQQRLAAEAVALDHEAVAANARGDGPAARAARARLQPVAQELDALDARLQAEFPAYAEMVSPPTLGLSELQSRLGADEALLLLVPVREHVHVFAVSKASAKWHRFDDGAVKVAQQVARLRCQVDPAGCGGAGSADARGVQSVFGTAVAQGGKAFDRDVAFALYHALVEPVEGAFAGAKRIYVASAGELGKLPLGVLITRAPAAGEDDADPAVLARSEWLADRYALVTLPAVSALRAPVAAPPATRGAGFAGFGAPVLLGSAGAARSAGDAKLFTAAGSGGVALANVEALRRLAPLPGTQVELQAMAQLYGAGSKLALGAEATEARLKSSPSLSNAQVLAFATHGLLPREVRGMDEPGLVFTPPARATPVDDGVLTASEAASLPLAAEWIILSACNTAAADGSSGAQSLSGLARAFLYAGAEALLASHWRVSDDATAALTTETLSAHRAGAGRAAALQQAMRAVRRGQRADGSALPGWKPGWSHPAAWAPFVLISDRDR